MSENKEEQTAPEAPLKDQLDEALGTIVDHPGVQQAFMVVLTEDDEIVRTKGHFYDNAALLNSVLSDLREKVYLDIFSGPQPRR